MLPDWVMPMEEVQVLVVLLANVVVFSPSLQPPPSSVFSVMPTARGARVSWLPVVAGGGRSRAALPNNPAEGLG
jgi:hypothetical protein